MSEAEIEKEIQDKGLVAPRLTPDLINAAILSEVFHVFPDSCLTVCCLTLQNGFTVTGESACASPENFDAEIGQKIARENARNKIWALEGYVLKELLGGHRFKPTVIDIAKVCHEVNKAYCIAFGDDSQPDWENAPDWQLQSAIRGVVFHQENPEASASNSHESWYAEKEADGWVYGEVKDPEKKEHPCMVAFDELPAQQKAKDYLFRQIVHSLS